MTVAVVDIGSNSTRLLIADVDGGRVSELVRHSNVTRLGAGVDKDGRLRADAMQRVYTVLDGYHAEMTARHVTDNVAVLTSAVRDSANGQDFADSIKDRYGLNPRVLTGDQEAQLTYRGATSERDPSDRTPTLVLDIGGGSTELVIGEGSDMRFHVSTQAGVVRQTERHLHDDPPTQPQIDALVSDVNRILTENVPQQWRSQVRRGIGVAGTATSLGAIAQRLDPYDPAKVHGYQLAISECNEILERLLKMGLEERKQVPGLHPDRAATIIAGVLIFRCVVSLFGLQSMEISEHDILRGAALDLVGR